MTRRQRILTALAIPVSLLCAAFFAAPALAQGQGPSFDCSAVAKSSIEALVCQGAGLSALDYEGR